MLEFDLDNEQLERWLAVGAQRLADAAPLMRGILGDLRSETEANFMAEGRPKWMGVKYNPGHGMILNRTPGGLVSSIQGDHDASTATIGSNKPYAAIHQLGGRTRPHTIQPRTKKALAFGGRFAKRVNHPGSVIPARPFLPVTASGSLQPEAEEAVLYRVQVYLRQILG